MPTATPAAPEAAKAPDPFAAAEALAAFIADRLAAGPKPGWATTEFWLTLVADVVAVVALVHPGFRLPVPVETVAAAGASLASLGYAASRAVLKRTHVRAAASVAAAAKVV